MHFIINESISIKFEEVVKKKEIKSLEEKILKFAIRHLLSKSPHSVLV